ncbi:MAG: alpha/beta hydrolase [Candidatus Nanopelagicales bacterium]
MTGARRRKWPWVIVFGFIALLGVFFIGGGWFFSGQVYADALESEPYDPAGLQSGSVTAVDGTGERTLITIRPDEQYRAETKFDQAQMGLVVGESLVVVGPAIRDRDGDKTRPVIEIIGQTPRIGDRYGLTRDVWLDPEQAGLNSTDVDIETPDGRTFPAWQIDAKKSAADEGRWAILTHGKGAARSEMLRMARPLRKSGYTVLVISYTGDAGAPAPADGMVSYGRTEWQELEAAVQYALDEGASTIVLGGTSHGGAVTLGFLARGSLIRKIDGIILDSPATSFEDVIDEAAEYRTLPIGGLAIPESLEEAAKLAVAFRYGVDFKAVDYTDSPGLAGMPLLTFQGVTDKTVPQAVNDRLMRTGAGQDGTYVLVPGADHVLAWNVDPGAYDKAVRAFVKQLDG